MTEHVGHPYGEMVSDNSENLAISSSARTGYRRSKRGRGCRALLAGGCRRMTSSSRVQPDSCSRSSAEPCIIKSEEYDVIVVSARYINNLRRTQNCVFSQRVDFNFYLNRKISLRSLTFLVSYPSRSRDLCAHSTRDD